MANIPLWASQVVLVVKAPPAKCRRCMRYGFDPWVGKIPWRRAWQPTLVFLPGESHGQRSQAGYSPWGHKESDTTEQVSMHITCQCSIVYITRIFFTHSSVDGHLRFFHVLATVNSAAVNTGVHVSFLKMRLTLASYWTYHASCKCGELQFLFYLKNIYLFGSARSQLHYSRSLVAAFGILFPDQGSNTGPLHWERGVLASRPPGKSWGACMFFN